MTIDKYICYIYISLYIHIYTFQNIIFPFSSKIVLVLKSGSEHVSFLEALPAQECHGAEGLRPGDRAWPNCRDNIEM